MSTPRLISPMLDNFIMGEPIYDKGGVRLCPAMEQGKEDKYIVKIVSIPANQSQVDALLITGAYKDEASVNQYFAELADAVIQEAGVLSKFSASGGFDGFKDMQVVPMDDGNGFDVYLLSPYCPTWDRITRQKPVTQLDGYNLALDLCAALSVARRNGYLYVNLRPESVSVTPSGSYHICDLGLIGLDYLQYSSLPSNYFTPYTAPEVADAFSALNSTMDIYSLGMMLYEVFNCGLPFEGPRANAEEYPAPVHAEEEFAQIILKAIHPDPASRWEDPTQMGQAIVSVMQRKGVSDAVILPVVEIAEEPQEPEEEEDILALADEFLVQASADDVETAADAADLSPKNEIEAVTDVQPDLATESLEEPIQVTEPPAEILPEPTKQIIDNKTNEATPVLVSDPVIDEEAPVQNEPETNPVSEDSSTSDVADEGEDVISEEIAPDAPVTAGTDGDLDNILLEAEKLISELELEAPVVTPEESYEQLTIVEPSEPIEITEEPAVVPAEAEVPADITEAAEKPADSAEPAEAAEVLEATGDDEHVDVVPPLPVDPEDKTEKPKKSVAGKFIVIGAAIVLAVMLIFSLFLYRFVYIQEIDTLSVSGTADSISVSVVSDVASGKLSVVCIDDNGNTFEARLNDYRATITGLSAETGYTVFLKMDGIHKLIGDTSRKYTTAEKSLVSNFKVLNGLSEGTAELTFQLTGPDEGEWSATFKAQGESDLVVTVEDGTATIVGLTAGKTYTVILTNNGSLYLDGTLETTFTPGPVIKAKDACVTSCANGKLSVQWSSDSTTSWVVHCYNDAGFDETVTVDDTKAEFTVPDDRKAYTVEVSAEGQSAKETLHVTENAINLSDFQIDTSVPGVITMNWTASADIPTDGYLVTYKVDDFEGSITASGNSLTLSGAVPNAVHSFTFAGANGQSVLCAPVTATATGESKYAGHGITADNLRFNLCLRPNKTNWTQSDVSSSYTTTFAAGQNASIVGRIITRYFTSDKMITTAYVFRNAEGQVVHVCSVTESWGDMWYNGYGYFDIPSLPSAAGVYEMSIYFDGALAYNTDVTIK